MPTGLRGRGFDELAVMSRAGPNATTMPSVRALVVTYTRAYHATSGSHARSAHQPEVLVIGIFSEWRLANKLALQAEAIVLAGMNRMLNKQGAEPTDEEVATARRLRAVANDLFDVAMKEMADRARALRK